MKLMKINFYKRKSKIIAPRLSSLSTNLWMQCRGKKAGREGFVEQVGFKLGVTLWGNSGLWGWWNDRKTEKVSLKWQDDYDSEVERQEWCGQLVWDSASTEVSSVQTWCSQVQPFTEPLFIHWFLLALAHIKLYSCSGHGDLLSV